MIEPVFTMGDDSASLPLMGIGNPVALLASTCHVIDVSLPLMGIGNGDPRE